MGPGRADGGRRRRPAAGSPTSVAAPRRTAATGSATNGLVHEAARRILAAERLGGTRRRWRRVGAGHGAYSPWSDCSARTGAAPAQPEAAPMPRRGRRAAGHPHAPADARRARRPGAAAGAGLGAAPRDRGGPPALDDPARAARQSARRRWRGSSPTPPDAAFEEESAVQAGRAEVRAVIERARERLRSRPPDRVLPRRDPPLQQGPAGRAAAGGRGRADHADRRHHREPVLRGQLGPDLAHPSLRARGAGARRRSACCSIARSAAGHCGAAGRTSTRRRSSSSPSAPAATPGRRSTRSSSRARPRAERTSRSTLAHAEDALQRRALLYDRQADQPLRHDLGLDQGHPRLGPRRVAVLPGGDARGRRGPALHRPADGDPRLRGHRQRRPAGAGRSPPRPPPRSSTWGCRSASSRSPRPRSTCRWPRSPTPPSGRCSRPAITSASAAPPPPPPHLRSSTRSDGDYDNPHRRPGPPLARRSCCPTPPSGARFYAPDDAEAALRERLDEIRRGRGGRRMKYLQIAAFERIPTGTAG